ncbi:hypothetical protein PsYK624_090890 [Phanerochaete sordida]|uniref:Uncharacterized protein n=1 Tax=Phanerochaete sordida TaxID=48140 RepID=A0A9P3GDT3_9APHY|nr:hypothetical protein PsYK624_090890 [Phanerochaete sordida]
MHRVLYIYQHRHVPGRRLYIEGNACAQIAFVRKGMLAGPFSVASMYRRRRSTFLCHASQESHSRQIFFAYSQPGANFQITESPGIKTKPTLPGPVTWSSIAKKGRK